jgi:hypothetical protein
MLVIEKGMERIQNVFPPVHEPAFGTLSCVEAAKAVSALRALGVVEVPFADLSL